MGGETYVRNEDFKVTAILEGGALSYAGGSSSRVTDRFFLGSGLFRGFAPGGLGPREVDTINSINVNDALGGEYYAVARFETQFPIGLPEEYGIEFGAFFDAGSVWGLDSAHVGSGRHSIRFYTMSSPCARWRVYHLLEYPDWSTAFQLHRCG